MIASRILKQSLKILPDIIMVFGIFCAALYLRILFTENSKVPLPLRSDASFYYSSAYNLRHFSAHSVEWPKKEPPKTRTDLAPGYPLFLSQFIDFEVDGRWPPKAKIDAFLARVSFVQSVLGALTAVFTFGLAALAMPRFFALLAALLVACCPHLIAAENFLLTESLFTFLISLGILLLAWGWRSSRGILVLLGAIALALSAQVRPVSLFLCPFLALLFLLQPGSGKFQKLRLVFLNLFFLVLAIVAVKLIYQQFYNRNIKNSASVETAQEVQKRFFSLHGPWFYLKRTLIPPVFHIKGKSHVFNDFPVANWKNIDPNNRFKDYPLQYLTWNTYGRARTFWNFDNSYNGDVYIYPMNPKGFENNKLLRKIHRTFRILHWPLFFYALFALVYLILNLRRKAVPDSFKALLAPALVFIYFLGTLSLVYWLPRYSIPVRPVSYVLALGFLYFCFRKIFKLDPID